MSIGKDGDHWYVSDGGCLGDARSIFGFGKTLGEAIDSYNSQNPVNKQSTVGLEKQLHLTTDYYRKKQD